MNPSTLSTCALLILCATLVACGAKQTAVDAEEQAKAQATDDLNAAATDVKAAAAGGSLETILASDLRTGKERDGARHPKQTLEFFGVTPDKKVLEIWPGSGWYSQILVPYVGPTGNLSVTNYVEGVGSDYVQKRTTTYNQWLAGMTDGSKVKVVPVNPPDALNFGEDGAYDVVLTFRNIHNWMKGGYDREIYAQAFRTLKPGGIFGVVEHRGVPGTSREDSIKSGYVPQDVVIKDVEAAGFKLVATSEINANPKDTKDHAMGVWTLPPALKMGETDRAKYEAIGESDRMTLKFMKPEQ